MISLFFANHMVSAIMGETNQLGPLNEDYAYHLRNTPARTREPLPWRLLPQVLRAPLKARLAARRYERSLIAIWENSPHLLKDIGVILSNAAVLPDHLVTAPERVIKHVAAVDPAQVMQAELEFPPQIVQAEPDFPPKVSMPARTKPASRVSPALFPVRTLS